MASPAAGGERRLIESLRPRGLGDRQVGHPTVFLQHEADHYRAFLTESPGRTRIEFLAVYLCRQFGQVESLSVQCAARHRSRHRALPRCLRRRNLDGGRRLGGPWRTRCFTGGGFHRSDRWFGGSRSYGFRIGSAQEPVPVEAAPAAAERSLQVQALPRPAVAQAVPQAPARVPPLWVSPAVRTCRD